MNGNLTDRATISNGAAVSSRPDFSKKLQGIVLHIHNAGDLDRIVSELSQEICDLFHCERIVLYLLSEDKSFLSAKTQSSVKPDQATRLPVSGSSIPGHVALFRKVIRITNAQDPLELRQHFPALSFQSQAEPLTGNQSREMLVAPLLDPQTRELCGVIEFVNQRSGIPFTLIAEQAMEELCPALAVALHQDLRPRSRPAAGRSRYEALIADEVMSADEFDQAARSARLQGIDIEDILVNEFKIKLKRIGQAIGRFYNLPYEPYRPDRVKPIDLLKNLKRDYAGQHHWLPIEECRDGLIILAIDPEQVRNARVINTIFPKARLIFRTTTRAEFKLTLDQFFGITDDPTSVGDLLSVMRDDDDNIEISATDISAASQNELVKLVNKIIVDAHRRGASDIHIEPAPGKDKTVIRFRKDGSMEPYIEIPASYRNALLARIKIMCDLDISERRKPQDGKIRFRKYGPLDIDLRVATMPTAGGMEDVVIRLLRVGAPIPLEQLGVLPVNLARLKRVIENPYGIFFVCGPTGAGKTTTLHSVLHHLNKPETKIWTAEDPVEITQKGLRQVR